MGGNAVGYGTSSSSAGTAAHLTVPKWRPCCRSWAVGVPLARDGGCRATRCRLDPQSFLQDCRVSKKQPFDHLPSVQETK